MRKRIVLPMQADRRLDDEADRERDDHQREFGLVHDGTDQEPLDRRTKHRGADQNQRYDR